VTYYPGDIVTLHQDWCYKQLYQSPFDDLNLSASWELVSTSNVYVVVNIVMTYVLITDGKIMGWVRLSELEERQMTDVGSW
jgi:hypothetical protein